MRRIFFFLAVLATAGSATAAMGDILWTNGLSAVESAILVLFALSVGWIALSFWTSAAGAALGALGLDPITLRRRPAHAVGGPLGERTAVVMPIYNEDPARVFAGIEAIWRSLMATAEAEAFDLFVLSDTRKAEIAAEEERRCAALVARLGAAGRVHYRRRDENVGRKAGNVAEFCRRWGRRYAHLVVLDADSIMDGRTIVALARAMEANPRAGLIQTLPVPVNQSTPFGRSIQFASRLYGGVYAAGLAFWQGAEANFWGHNAIIRTSAFMAHCGLPHLPGRAPLGGEILSHDFVEAAFLRRGGWEVVLMPGIGGSYEEVPSNLLDYAKRDHRWCQGNLQHLGLLPARGLHPMSRFHLICGAFAYLASPIWLFLLVASSIDILAKALIPFDYFGTGPALFPVWPVSRGAEIVSLFALTTAMLFVPKLMALALALARPAERRAYGGGLRLTASVLAETALSVLRAPILMALQCRSVFSVLAGRSVAWTAQARGARGLAWSEAARTAAVPSALGLAWGGLIHMAAPALFLWVLPVVLGFLVTIPLMVAESRERLGFALYRLGLWRVPEETRRSAVLRRFDRAMRLAGAEPAPPLLDHPLPEELPGEMSPEPLAFWSPLRPAGPRRRRLGPPVTQSS